MDVQNESGCISHHCHISSKCFPVQTRNKSYPQSQLLSLATQRLTSSPRSPQSSSAYFLRYCFSYSDRGSERQQRHEEPANVKTRTWTTSSYRTIKWRKRAKLQAWWMCAKSSYLAADVDWYAYNDDWDGDACYQGDDHRGTEQHAHLPHNLAGLRPWLLPPERASWGAERHDSGHVKNTVRHGGLEMTLNRGGKIGELVSKVLAPLVL